MKKWILGVFFGTLAWFLWGMFSWMVLPWHIATIDRMPEEKLLRDTFKVVIQQPGLYHFPSDRTESGEHMSMEDWKMRAKSGPVGLLIVDPAGGTGMTPRHFMVNIGLGAIISGLLIWLLGLIRGRCTGIFSRMKISMMIGLVVWLAAQVPYWNWFYFPCDFILVSLFDTLIVFGLMGVAVSKFVPSEK